MKGRMPRVKGFTLIELLAVIVLAGALAAFATTLTPGRKIDLRAQAEQIASAIRYTQQLSMTRWQRFRINFSSDHYQITSLDGLEAVRDPGYLTTQANLQAGVVLTSSQPFIVFNSLGVPYQDAEQPGTPQASQVSVTLTAGSDRQTIVMSAETGRVSVNG